MGLLLVQNQAQLANIRSVFALPGLAVTAATGLSSAFLEAALLVAAFTAATFLVAAL